MKEEKEKMSAKELAQNNNSSVQDITNTRLGTSQSESKQPELSDTGSTAPTQSTVPTQPKVSAETKDDQGGSTNAKIIHKVIKEDNCVYSSQVDLLIDYVTSNGFLFHSPDGHAYVSLVENGHEKNIKIRCEDFKKILKRVFYIERMGTPTIKAIRDTVNILEAEAWSNAPEIPLHIRYAKHEGSIFIDLCNSSSEQVWVKADGWTIIKSKDSPIRFSRIQGMTAIPTPVRGGSIDLLKKYLNIDNDEDWIMIVAWLVGAINPLGPFPPLVIQGEQGAGKSSFAKILRWMTDPSTVPSQSMPSSERNLVIAAANSWVQNFDNLSSQKTSISDALCRLATGGGFRTRSVRTDDEERLFNSTRPMILNGIADIVNRHDLADRSIFINLPAMSGKQRKPESEFLQEFFDNLPSLLGALYDTVSMALRNYNTVNTSNLPRMADFAKWVIAAEPALPWEQGKFLKIYNENRSKIIDDAIESDIVACAVIQFINNYKKGKQWKGTPTELLPILEHNAPEWSGWKSDWPKAPNALSNRLIRVKTFLKTKGIMIERGKSGKRHFTISLQEQSDTQAVPKAKTMQEYAARQIDKNNDFAGSGHPSHKEMEIEPKSLSSDDENTNNSTTSEYEEGEI